jgi:hypothetical protein
LAAFKIFSTSHFTGFQDFKLFRRFSFLYDFISRNFNLKSKQCFSRQMMDKYGKPAIYFN